MHQVHVGDRFKLLGKEFTINHIWSTPESFEAQSGYDTEITWPISEADALEWIEEPVMFTKEQVEAIKNKMKHLEVATYNECSLWPKLEAFLDSHTQD